MHACLERPGTRSRHLACFQLTVSGIQDWSPWEQVPPHPASWLPQLYFQPPFQFRLLICVHLLFGWEMYLQYVPPTYKSELTKAQSKNETKMK